MRSPRKSLKTLLSKKGLRAFSQEVQDHEFFEEHDTPHIPFYGEEGFEGMRAAGKLTAEVLDYITPFVQPGVTTDALDQKIHDFMIANGAIPATLGYKGYTKSCCTSINHVICHGIPDRTVLQEGDMLNIDVSIILKGWFGDASRMFYVGAVSDRVKRLTETTLQALERAISIVRPGIRLGDVGYAIQSFAESKGYQVVREFCGHGIGRVFHGPPTVLHYGVPGHGVVLKPGMFFTIEPMINEGVPGSKVLSDGWTAITLDGKYSAQWEHTIGVTETGAEVLTRSPKGWALPPYL